MENRERIVTEIPVLYRGNLTEIAEKENVTYYARVSTDFDEQEDSFERQRDHFEHLIKSRSDWNYVEGYADQGLSGTAVEHRPEFLRMIEDCKKGKIDKILVKSISRFARNTVDTLQYIRILKELGIGVYFETQGIDTMTPNGEVLITILAALAEQESRNISSNVKWSYQKRFKDGKVLINYVSTLGYGKQNDEYVIIEEEAKIVRRIFSEYLSGKTTRQIADDLNKEQIYTKKNNPWQATSIQRVLDNEKYTGNAYLGKTFKSDVLSKKRVVNKGQEKMYYVQNSHPAIISQEIYNKAKVEKEKRLNIRSVINTGKGRYSSKYPLSGLLVCAECGSRFRRHGRPLKSGENVGTWICIQHQKDIKSCGMKPLREEDILKAYEQLIEMVYDDLKDIVNVVKKNISKEIKIDSPKDLGPVQEEIAELRQKILELLRSKRNGKISQEAYDVEYRRMSTRVKELEKIETEINDASLTKMINNDRLTEIMKILDRKPDEFKNPNNMKLIVECIKVVEKHQIEFQLLGGQTIQIKI